MPGTLTASNINDGTNVGSTTDMIKGSARAWVSFNGVTTTTIRSSYNILTVTRTAIGNYTITFNAPLADANYAAVAMAQFTSNGASICHIQSGSTPLPGSFSLQIYNTLTGNIDSPVINIVVCR